ncbi:hypothetical protein BS78_05G129400 [Paspalum vaginatum]|nr:hypothetical protein BS78_05G129400 [Paspalum vaginatum]
MAATRLSLLALTMPFLVTVVYSERRGFRATMIRAEKAINFTQASRKSHERMSLLASRLDAASSSGPVSTYTQAPLQVDSEGFEFNMEFSIGTPPQTLTAIADTGSELTWVKCGACSNCTPLGSPYRPDTSTSFSTLPCSDRLCGALSASVRTCGSGGAVCEYTYHYGLELDAHRYTRGHLGNETFTLGGEAVPGIAFGCTTMSEGIYGASSGIVGLGRGRLSIVSQLKAGEFSYCLSDTSTTSPLLFGSLADMTGDGVQSTPLLAAGTYYAVNLEHISIGADTTIGPGTSFYGTLLDSGTTLTFLAEPFYTFARAVVLNQTTLPRVADRHGSEACFQAPGGDWRDFPGMVLHFDGAEMVLPATSCFAEAEDGVVCWIVLRSPSLSIIGNIMQRNYQIRYDDEEAVVSFKPANCDNL